MVASTSLATILVESCAWHGMAWHECRSCKCWEESRTLDTATLFLLVVIVASTATRELQLKQLNGEKVWQMLKPCQCVACKSAPCHYRGRESFGSREHNGFGAEKQVLQVRAASRSRCPCSPKLCRTGANSSHVFPPIAVSKIV